MNLDPEYYQIPDQEISILEVSERKKLEPLIRVLIEWINDELAESRIIVKDLQEDLYDGHILQLLMEKLSNVQISDTKLKLGEEAQKQQLKNILDFINETLGETLKSSKWKLGRIYEKDLIAILHLLVEIVKHFGIDIRVPENLSVRVLVVKKGKTLEKKTIFEQITENDILEKNQNRDAFDLLIEHSKEKFNQVKQRIFTTFKNYLHELEIDDPFPEKKISDGVYLIIVLALLEGYYIPEYCYHSSPKSIEDKKENIKFLFGLLKEQEIEIPNSCRIDDIASGCETSILRFLFHLFNIYRNSN